MRGISTRDIYASHCPVLVAGVAIELFVALVAVRLALVNYVAVVPLATLVECLSPQQIPREVRELLHGPSIALVLLCPARGVVLLPRADMSESCRARATQSFITCMQPEILKRCIDLRRNDFCFCCVGLHFHGHCALLAMVAELASTPARHKLHTRR